MSKFKINENVVCINADSLLDIKEGGTYKVTGYDRLDFTVNILTDKGCEACCRSDRFATKP